MAEFDYNTRRVISDRRKAELNRRIEKFAGRDRELAREVAEKTAEKRQHRSSEVFMTGIVRRPDGFGKRIAAGFPGT